MPTYNRPSGYTQVIPPGVKAIREYIRDHFGYSRTEVVRDRSRCAKHNSEHCVCRAIDAFTTDPEKGRKLFDWAVRNADRFGFQSAIFRDREWGFGNWRERHRSKRDHFDHVHLGINLWGAKNVTRAMLEGSASPSPTPPPQNGTKCNHPTPTVSEDTKGVNEAVKNVQRHLNSMGFRGPNMHVLTVDGRFGEKTKSALVGLQKRAFRGQPKEWDGIVGKKTWPHLCARKLSPESPK